MFFYRKKMSSSVQPYLRKWKISFLFPRSNFSEHKHSRNDCPLDVKKTIERRWKQAENDIKDFISHRNMMFDVYTILSFLSSTLIIFFLHHHRWLRLNTNVAFQIHYCWCRWLKCHWNWGVKYILSTRKIKKYKW
jgi:hypothetical protein